MLSVSRAPNGVAMYAVARASGVALATEPEATAARKLADHGVALACADRHEAGGRGFARNGQVLPLGKQRTLHQLLGIADDLLGRPAGDMTTTQHVSQIWRVLPRVVLRIANTM